MEDETEAPLDQLEAMEDADEVGDLGDAKGGGAKTREV
jgi:hypothetical protein